MWPNGWGLNGCHWSPWYNLQVGWDLSGGWDLRCGSRSAPESLQTWGVLASLCNTNRSFRTLFKTSQETFGLSRLKLSEWLCCPLVFLHLTEKQSESWGWMGLVTVAPMGFSNRVVLRVYTYKYFAFSSCDFSGLPCNIKLWCWQSVSIVWF